MKARPVLATIALTLTMSACMPIQVPDLYPSQAAVRHPEVRSMVEGLTYRLDDPTPATSAYRAVAEARGWSQTTIDRWQPFLIAVMRRESHFCPNVRRGARIARVEGCVLARQGRGTDSGFGQVISLHYRQGAWLCNQEGLCSAEAIVGSPWNSMTAFLALVERAGRQGWCYTPRLKRGEVCQLAPAGKPVPVN